MASDQGSERNVNNTITGFGGLLLTAWLGILLPIATAYQLSYLSSYLAKLSEPVVAALAFMMIAMVTLSLWAAIGLWQGRRGARESVEQALLFGIAANVLCCAPLSILMSAPPVFLPVLLVTLIGMTLLDIARQRATS